MYRKYRRLMDWEDPLFTLIVFGEYLFNSLYLFIFPPICPFSAVLFVVYVLKVEAEYGLSLPLFVLVCLDLYDMHCWLWRVINVMWCGVLLWLLKVLMWTDAWYTRYSGIFRKQWVWWTHLIRMNMFTLWGYILECPEDALIHVQLCRWKWRMNMPPCHIVRWRICEYQLQGAHWKYDYMCYVEYNFRILVFILFGWTDLEIFIQKKRQLLQAFLHT